MKCPKCSHSFKVAPNGRIAAVGGGTLMAGLGASQKRLYIKRPSGKVFGPFERASIKTMLAANKLSREALFSSNKVDWLAVENFPEFSGSATPQPTTDEVVKSTQMAGWPSANQQPKTIVPDLQPKTLVPDFDPNLKPKTVNPLHLEPDRLKLPTNLPTPKNSSTMQGLPMPKGRADLPVKQGSNLPQKQGLPNLPKKASGFPSAAEGAGTDLPGLFSELPAPSSSLPAPLSSLPGLRGGDLPARADSLPVSAESNLPGNFGNVDLPVVPGKPGRTMGAALAPLEDDDDLFSTDDDDLFISEGSLVIDASSVGFDDSEADLFGRSEPEEALLIQRNDDFHADEEEDTSFFGSGGSGTGEKSDGWGGGDLFGEKSHGDDFGNPDHVSDAFDDWGDDLLADGRSSSVAESPFPEGATPDATKRLEPKEVRAEAKQLASSGAATAPPEKKAAKESSKDDDKKRGILSFVAVFAVLAVLGGVGWVVYGQFFEKTNIVPKAITEKKAKKINIELGYIKADNFDTLSQVTESANSAKVDAAKRGTLLLTQSLFLSRYEEPKTFESAKKLSATLDSASTDFEKLGRGAFDAVQGNEAAALTYLSELTGNEELIGFYANALIGIANVKSIENEMLKPIDNFEKTSPDKDSPEDQDANKEEVVGEEPKKEGEVLPDNNEKENKGEPSTTTVEPLAQKGKENSERFLARKSRAIQALKVATEMDSSSPIPGYWLGRLYELMKEPKLAQQAYDRTSNVTHVGSLLQSGKIGVELGNLNGAIISLEKINAELNASASPRELSRAHHFAGLVQSGRNKSELAIENFVKALSFEPSRADTLQKLAEEYERAKKFKEALNFFTTNKNLGKKNPDVMLGIVRSHIGLEQWISAIGQLESGQKQFPEDARFPSMLGWLYLKRGNFFDAQKPLERAVEINPTLLDSHAMLAQLAWRMDKDIKRGETHIAQIVAFPDFITAKIAAQVAEYYRMSKRRKMSHDWFRASLKADPNYWPARLAHARLLLEERRYDEARVLLEKARDEGVSDIRLSAYLADAYRQSKEYDRAIDEIKKVIAQFPDDEEYAFILGMIEFDRGNYETARKQFNHAYEINPKFHRAYFYVGRTLFAAKKSESALRIFRHVLDNEPNKGEYRFYMARALEEQNRTTQALDEYRKATAVDSTYGIENPSVYVYRGKLLSRLGYSAEGKTDIARALELDPTNIKALTAMGSVNFEEKDYVASIANYNLALKENPDDPAAQAQLGMAYLYTDKLRAAAEHLQLAVKYGYKNLDVYKDLGYLYKDLGQGSLAKKSFKKYLELTKDQQIPAATKKEILEQIRSLN